MVMVAMVTPMHQMTIYQTQVFSTLLSVHKCSGRDITPRCSEYFQCDPVNTFTIYSINVCLPVCLSV
jgi:hypothetical protein